ncbi:Alf1 protein [Saccharomycopsis crataegensis]|uniref:Alf1 protein n=1 Tax=Saccharomycopsis crataegensis TaxID=43959 RepID=A0AAV5QR78_9ASCO|nr:Alf1 protein [Saccharomycopsis crataegensis]
MSSDISVFVTSSLTSSERRISPNWTLSHFKVKLEQITGIPPANQKLLVYGSSNSPDYQLLKSIGSESSATLSQFDFLKPFVRIHVDDTNPNPELEELAKSSQQEMENISGADILNSGKYIGTGYEDKQDTVLKWKEKNQLGRFNPEYKEKQQQELENNIQCSSKIAVGARCRIKPDSSITVERRGTVRYVGKIPEITSTGAEFPWVGIELDEPLGKNDGSIKGKKYFSCNAKYGSFAKPTNVEIGDFPSLMDELMDSDDDINEEL